MNVQEIIYVIGGFVVCGILAYLTARAYQYDMKQQLKDQADLLNVQASEFDKYFTLFDELAERIAKLEKSKEPPKEKYLSNSLACTGGGR